MSSIYKPYTGIGSRETPDDILTLMSKLATILERQGYVLRSGGANGADKAFAKDVTNKEVFIPWSGFGNIQTGAVVGYSNEAMEIASRLLEVDHWARCSKGGKKLHARNVHQILGQNLDSPTSFVICWTPNGRLVGGTATAIKLAMENNIRVFNLANPEVLVGLEYYITLKG